MEFKDIPDFQSESFLTGRFSENYRTTEDYEKTRLKIELLERQLKEAEEQRYPKSKIIDQIVIPLFYDYMNLPILEKSKEIFEKYEDEFNNDNLKHLEIKFLHLKNLRKFEKALLVAGKMVKIEKKENKNNSLALSYYNIARIYKEQENYQKAIEFQLKSKSILEQDSTRGESLAACFNELATLSKRIKDYNKAEKYQLKGIELLKKNKKGSDFLKGGAYNNLSLIYLEKGDLNNAEKYILKSLDVLENHLDNLHPEIANCFHNYACILEKKGNLKRAILFEKKSFNILTKSQNSGLPLYEIVKQHLLKYQAKLSLNVNNKIGKNAPCPCGSSKKYKNCCIKKEKKILFLSTRTTTSYEMKNDSKSSF